MRRIRGRLSTHDKAAASVTSVACTTWQYGYICQSSCLSSVAVERRMKTLVWIWHTKVLRRDVVEGDDAFRRFTLLACFLLQPSAPTLTYQLPTTVCSKLHYYPTCSLFGSDYFNLIPAA